MALISFVVELQLVEQLRRGLHLPELQWCRQELERRWQ